MLPHTLNNFLLLISLFVQCYGKATKSFCFKKIYWGFEYFNFRTIFLCVCAFLSRLPKNIYLYMFFKSDHRMNEWVRRGKNWNIYLSGKCKKKCFSTLTRVQTSCRVITSHFTQYDTLNPFHSAAVWVWNNWLGRKFSYR